MSKQFFFEAGAFPDLSYVELIAVLESFNISKDIITRFGTTIFLVKNEKIDENFVINVFQRLGGCKRVGYIIEDIDNFSYRSESIQGNKIIFGISILGDSLKNESVFIKKLANSIKRTLRSDAISSRFIIPKGKDNSLNSAQVINNQIIEKGFELDILRNFETEKYGKTLMVQDLEGFVQRDMYKPNTDIQMGTLPPKLARMMVNFTAQNSGILWDPFCGSGTIPMEAVILGFNTLASDVNPVAVNTTSSNIEWLSKEGFAPDALYESFRFDVTKANKEVIKKLKNTDITAIVCEPYMGPPQTALLSEQKASELLGDVKNLYFKLFDLIDNKIEKRHIKVVLIIPSYKTQKGWKTFGIRELVNKRWIVKNGDYLKNRDLKWSRKNSIITRNIFILERS